MRAGTDSQIEDVRSIAPTTPSTAFTWTAGPSLSVQDLFKPAFIPPPHFPFISPSVALIAGSFPSPLFLPLPSPWLAHQRRRQPKTLTQPYSLSTPPALPASASSISRDQATPSNATPGPSLVTPSPNISLPSPASTNSSAPPTPVVDHFALCLPRPLSWLVPDQPLRQTDPSASNPCPLRCQ